MLAEQDGELVGHQALVAAEELGLGVELPLEALGDLDGLHVALERAREDAADGTLDAVLELVEQSHGPSSPRVAQLILLTNS